MKSKMEESALQLEAAQATALSKSPLPESLESLYQERQPKGYDAVLRDFLKLSKMVCEGSMGVGDVYFLDASGSFLLAGEVAIVCARSVLSHPSGVIGSANELSEKTKRTDSFPL